MGIVRRQDQLAGRSRKRDSDRPLHGDREGAVLGL